MSAILLNVADVRERSSVNGPKVRSVVWVQGCTIRCPGCFNPRMHPHKPVRLIDPRRLAERLLRISDTDGITLSGGEPFEQAKACTVLAEAIRRRGRSVMVFTGYPFDVLLASRSRVVRRFLGEIDLLVAGPYVRSLPGDGSLWRGSTNQTLHLLSDRLRHPGRGAGSSEPVTEVVGDGRWLLTTGFPTAQDQEWIAEVFQEACAWVWSRQAEREQP